MIITPYDTMLMKGYKKAILDLANYFDKRSQEFSREKLLNLPAIKSFLMCVYEESESFYLYGDFDKRVPWLSPAKNKITGKKQQRRFFFKDEENAVHR